MARRKKREEHVNHEAWAIPYGDLITLLLAFFVVMYAMSSVNEGKYRVLSDSLVAAFRSAPRSLEPIQVGQLSRSMQEVSTDRTRTLVPLELEQDLEVLLEELSERAHGRSHEQEPDRNLAFQLMRTTGFSLEELQGVQAMIESITESLAQELAALIEEDLVRIRRDRFWLEIEINTSVLFETASAQLSERSLPILRRVSEVLRESPTRIYVEGHTDARPISTAAFPSNWELSGARASSVVRLFADAGIAPEKMAAVGLGEFQPIAENESAEGRAQNRRVVIVVMSGRDRLFGERVYGAEQVDNTPAPAGDSAARS